MKQLLEIVPKYVNEAKPGKKYGSVKLDDDKKFLVPANLVNRLAPNTPAKVETHTENWKDGPVDIINKVIGGNGPMPAKQNVRQRMDPVDSLESRKTAVLAGWARAGKISVNRDAVKIALDELDAGCRMHGTNAQRADDMKDEIPEGDWAANSENPAD